MRDVLLYTVIRLALWGALWWILTQVGIGVYLAGVLAALIAMLLSIVLLNPLRDRAAMRWKAADDRRRERKGEQRDEDADQEDAILDAEGSPSTGERDEAGDDKRLEKRSKKA